MRVHIQILNKKFSQKCQHKLMFYLQNTVVMHQYFYYSETRKQYIKIACYEETGLEIYPVVPFTE